MLSPPGARGRGGATHRLSRARRTGQASTLVTEGNELGERLCTVVGTKPIWGSPPRGQRVRASDLSQAPAGNEDPRPRSSAHRSD